MAYQHDSDGPNVDKGGFRIKIFAYYACAFVVFAAAAIAVKIMFSKNDTMESIRDEISSACLFRTYHFDLACSEDAIKIRLWFDGIAATAKKASDGDSDALNEWQTIRHTVSEYNDRVYDILKSYEMADIDVTIALVNESNKDRILMVYKNNALDYIIA